MKTLVRLGSILLACTLAGSALAADRVATANHGDARTESVALQVRYDSRDLLTRTGAEKVHRKFVLAARRQCTFGNLLTELGSVDKQCLGDLVDKAVAQAGSLQLVEVHRGMDRVDLAVRR